VKTEIVISVGVSSIRARTQATTHPTASPIAMPPIGALTTRRPASASEKVPPTAAPTAAR
jgi:hypothetical protein